MSGDELLGAIEDREEGTVASQPRDAHQEARRLLLSSLYSRAVEAASSLEWPQARNLFRQIRKIDPDYRDTGDRLAQAEVRTRLAALYSTALDALADERWSEAVDSLSEIVAVDADYDEAAELLTRAGIALAEAASDATSGYAAEAAIATEAKTQEYLARPHHDGLQAKNMRSTSGNGERTETRTRPGPVSGADSDGLGQSSLATPSRRRIRESRRIRNIVRSQVARVLGRVRRNVTEWKHALSRSTSSASRADRGLCATAGRLDRRPAADEPRTAHKRPSPEKLYDTESELRKENGG